ncbi:Vacuolar protein sorting-associated protein 35 [Trichinella britovi]|uniref:Vacuolar protein sorting-associated protein 35 n=1 Tax=Trichinella britovi TaxID=45882 RepID=A0A0V1CKF7_TRIBR|nr:Vacuolar protein sorting-associated protein 35 [Trichinella britovi]
MVREEISDDTMQNKILDDSVRRVKIESNEMKKCLDKCEIIDALKHASVMLEELKTSALTPQYYYKLYIDITKELQLLDLTLTEELQKKNKINDLYEVVQYANSIIPRLYLLITVGIIYIKLGEASAKEMLKDMVEMCRGVQHPLRGLFLRSYLLQCTKNLLPNSTVTNEKEDNGTLQDSVEFILSNFAEMNKLWVRMQHQGQSRDREQREKERREIQVLVGTNLVRLAQLETIDVDMYKKYILPKILEQVVCCRDAIAQEYLMECLIDVFPDEFHVRCLNIFLKTCADIHQMVNIRNVLVTLIERLSSLGVTEEGRIIQEDANLFDVLSDEIASIVQSRVDMPTESVVALQVSMMDFALKCYQKRCDYADKVLQVTCSLLQCKSQQKFAYNSPVGKELIKLLRLPVDFYNNAMRLLLLKNYPLVLSLLDHRGRIKCSCQIVYSMLEQRTFVKTAEQAEMLLNLLQTLIKDEPDQPKNYEITEEFVEEQILISRLIHLFSADSLDVQYDILMSCKSYFTAGGAHRYRYTLVPVVFSAFDLVRKYSDVRDQWNNIMQDNEWENKVEKLIKLIHQLLSLLMSQTRAAHLPIRLYLQGALLINSVPMEKSSLQAYEFIAQAFAIYEEEISVSKEKLAAIILIAGTLQRMTCFGEDDHERLRDQCRLAASKLISKSSQCRAVATCAHLFWSSRIADRDQPMHDGEQVVNCLKKCLQIASQCMDPCAQVQLFTEILDHYVYFAEDGCKEIVTHQLNELIAKIRETLLQLEPSSDSEQIQKHFNNSVEHLREKADAAEVSGSIAFAELIL